MLAAQKYSCRPRVRGGSLHGVRGAASLVTPEGCGAQLSEGSLMATTVPRTHSAPPPPPPALRARSGVRQSPRGCSHKARWGWCVDRQPGFPTYPVGTPRRRGAEDDVLFHGWGARATCSG